MLKSVKTDSTVVSYPRSHQTALTHEVSEGDDVMCVQPESSRCPLPRRERTCWKRSEAESQLKIDFRATRSSRKGGRVWRVSDIPRFDVRVNFGLNRRVALVSIVEINKNNLVNSICPESFVQSPNPNHNELDVVQSQARQSRGRGRQLRGARRINFEQCRERLDRRQEEV
ncbi:hypothetical protein BLNAU_9838 [Blattamonas nauphoetae]|uniref:Uncharacterized protein n=1 Tax=Blattamonas nauphoetae TaxID=2049346 RepID=A0ABQ9XUF8_9EUKA|nr:hypothetical protein BLNAU_9838 [Blattamonas nauphoetae]